MRKYAGILLVSFLLIGMMSSCGNNVEKTDGGRDNIVEYATVEPSATQEPYTLENALQEDWGIVLFSFNGSIRYEEEKTFHSDVGTFAQILIKPSNAYTVGSSVREQLEDECDKITVSLESDNENILCVLENENGLTKADTKTVLFRAPGTANLTVTYTAQGISHNRVIRCAVNEDKNYVGCDPIYIGEPDRCLALDDGSVLIANTGKTGGLSGYRNTEYLRALPNFDAPTEGFGVLQPIWGIEAPGEISGLCKAEGRIYFYYFDQIYVLSEDMQSYTSVYSVRDFRYSNYSGEVINNLFSVNDKLYAEISGDLGTFWVKLTPDANGVTKDKSTKPFDKYGFTAVSYYNGTVHFIGTPTEGTFADKKNEYVLDLESMVYYPCTGTNWMNNYGGNSIIGDGITYTLGSNTPYIYAFPWGDVNYGGKLFETEYPIGAMTLYDGKIYYTEIHPTQNELKRMKLKCYDLTTQESTDLYLARDWYDDYKSTNVTLYGRLCVANGMLFYLGETYAGNDVYLPIYNIDTGEVKYWRP